MKKSFLVAFTATISAVFLLSFKESAPNQSIAQQEKLLHTIGKVLRASHFETKKYDDTLSVKVWESYINRLDPDKNIFQVSDIKLLKKFQYTIDNEISGDSIQFYPEAVRIFKLRLQEAAAECSALLAKPFNYNKNQPFQNLNVLSFPANKTERKERLKAQLKLMILQNYSTLLAQRKKNPSLADSISIDQQIEKEARDKVLRLTNLKFQRLASELSSDIQFKSFVNCIIAYLDPHSEYLPPAERKAFDEYMSKRFYGIGTSFIEEDGLLKITALEPGSPSFKNPEIKINDKILKIGEGLEGEMIDVFGMNVNVTSKMLRGDKDSSVRLLLQHADGTEVTVTLKRAEIVQESSFAKSVVIDAGNQKIGYILLPQFYEDFKNIAGAHSSVDVAKQITLLKAQKIEGLVFDLRNNGGGSLAEVVKMVGLFIDYGPVVQVKNKWGVVNVLEDKDPEIQYNGPLVVLVNEFSASASEIFTAAIQDYNRGIIIGSTSTFGKGTVQTQVSLTGRSTNGIPAEDNGGLKLTTQKFYRINGSSTQIKGIVPDVILADAYELSKVREKDRPFALAWNQIDAANYAPLSGLFNRNNIQKQTENRLSLDTVFINIQKDTERINQLQKNKSSLALKAYLSQKKELEILISHRENLLKLPKDKTLEINSLDGTEDVLNSSEVKEYKYKQWMNRLSSDIYLNQAVSVVQDIIQK